MLMKRIVILIVMIVAAFGSASAQNYIIVNSEKIFKSLNDYNTALEELDKRAEAYQKQVDDQFAEVEAYYNVYMSRRESLSMSARSANEEKILQMEQEATALQEKIFGNEGMVMQERVQMIQPIQKRVFDAIESYAKSKGYDVVFDSASNATLLYNSAQVDHTEQIIEMLK